MEGKTPTEKVSNLANLVATLTVQVQKLDADIKLQASEHARTSHTLAELKNTVIRFAEQLVQLQEWRGELGSLTDLKTDVAVLKRDVAGLEKVKEEWGRRLWAMAGPILGALVGWALGYFSRR